MVVSQSLIAFDTDHIKRYVFGTNKLTEIRGASSRIDRLNRQDTKEIAESSFQATTIFAHGGSALFLVDSDKAERLGKEIQKLYHEETEGGASITYAIQHIPDYGSRDIMTTESVDGQITMTQVLKLLRLRLHRAKEDPHINAANLDETQEEGREELVADSIALPSHAFLCTCNSCGISYAADIWEEPDDDEEPEDRYCRICIHKRREDRRVKNMLSRAKLESLPLHTHSGDVYYAH